MPRSLGSAVPRPSTISSVSPRCSAAKANTTVIISSLRPLLRPQPRYTLAICQTTSTPTSTSPAGGKLRPATLVWASLCPDPARRRTSSTHLPHHDRSDTTEPVPPCSGSTRNAISPLSSCLLALWMKAITSLDSRRSQPWLSPQRSSLSGDPIPASSLTNNSC